MTMLRRDSGNYIFIYGGWNGHTVLNDIYMISVDSTYNATLIWQEYTNTRGSWHMNYFAIPFLPFDSLAGLPGFVGRHILEDKLPKRYGHGLVSMTSSFDGVNETRDILMSFSGAQEDEMSLGLNLDAYGLFKRKIQQHITYALMLTWLAHPDIQRCWRFNVQSAQFTSQSCSCFHRIFLRKPAFILTYCSPEEKLHTTSNSQIVLQI